MTCGCIENHLTNFVFVGIMASIPIVVYLYWKYFKLRKPEELPDFSYNDNPDFSNVRMG